MFEDIIGGKKGRLRFNLKAELEKNGQIIPEAEVVLYADTKILTGYIICPGLTADEGDYFCLFFSKEDGAGELIKIFEYPVPIFVDDKEIDGKIAFTLATDKGHIEWA